MTNKLIKLIRKIFKKFFFFFYKGMNLQLIEKNKIKQNLGKKEGFVVLYVTINVCFISFFSWSRGFKIIGICWQRNIYRPKLQLNPTRRASTMISWRFLQFFVHYSRWVQTFQGYLYVLQLPIHQFYIVSSFHGHPNCGQHLRNFLQHLCRLVQSILLRHRDAKIKKNK